MVNKYGEDGMSLRSMDLNVRPLRRAAFAAAALTLAAVCQASSVAAGSPFGGLHGSWSGGGTISVSNGTTERLRCRAAYNVLDDGGSVRLNLRCASDSYNFDLLASVRDDGGAISGSWTETTRDASGTISGRVRGDQISVTAKGSSFAANLLMVTHGNHQSVSIRASGADIAGVDIALRRM
jgi:hypothetical protein